MKAAAAESSGWFKGVGGFIVMYLLSKLFPIAFDIASGYQYLVFLFFSMFLGYFLTDEQDIKRKTQGLEATMGAMLKFQGDQAVKKAGAHLVETASTTPPTPTTPTTPIDGAPEPTDEEVTRCIWQSKAGIKKIEEDARLEAGRLPAQAA